MSSILISEKIIYPGAKKKIVFLGLFLLFSKQKIKLILKFYKVI
jgi:hypothetical protein